MSENERGESKVRSRMTTAQRLYAGLNVLKIEAVCEMARQIYIRHGLPNGASIFWDEDDHEVQFCADDFEIIIRENRTTKGDSMSENVATMGGEAEEQAQKKPDLAKLSSDYRKVR